MMKKAINIKISITLLIILLILIPFEIISNSIGELQNSRLIKISNVGLILDSQLSEINVDVGTTVGSNNLSTGFQISYGSGAFLTTLGMRQIAMDAKFKIVRFCDTLGSQWIPSMMPCTHFFDKNGTGIYDWTNVDNMIEKIFEIGAEPLICLGTTKGGQLVVPLGMIINSTTNLPNLESYSVYCAEWVNHFKTKGWDVRFYEIVNEPWTYFGWDPINYTLLSNYMNLFDACANRMRQENTSIDISFDFIGRKPVMDYWLEHGGADVDSINFHDYSDYIVNGRTDEDMFMRAETEYFGKWPLGYSVIEARQTWFNSRGKILPIIASESNFNSAWINGTDPRNQQIVGAVWLALVLRMDVLNGVSFNIYYELAESANWGKTTQTGGYGFGMINKDNLQPWYPYYVNYIIGNYLGVGDLVKASTSSSEDIKTLAWIHGQKLNILLICRVDQQRIISFRGINGQGTVIKIDNTISWQHPKMQNETVDFNEPFIMKGYTVALLQKDL